MRILIFITVFLFAFGNNLIVKGQNTYFPFEKLPAQVGWTDGAINDIIQDYKGFIWTATWAGLKKFDGYTVKTYSQELDIQNGLNGNKIKCLFEDSQHRLWVGTNYTGFYLYDRLQDKFIQFQKERDNMNSLSNNHVLAIHEDKEGYIWIGTEKGLNRFDPISQNFVHYHNSELGGRMDGTKGIVSLATSKNVDLWVGSEFGLERLVKGKNGQPDYFIQFDLAPKGVPQDDADRHNFIFKIIPSKLNPNSLWIGTSIGLKKVTYFPDDPTTLDFKTYLHDKTLNQGLSHSFVSDIFEDESRKNIWVGTFNGLNLLNLEEQKFEYFYHDKYSDISINNNVIHSLYKDRSDQLWIGTDRGINKVNFSSQPFKSIRISEGRQDLDLVSSIDFSKSKNGIWISTNGSGLGFIPFSKEKDFLLSEIIHYPVKAKLKEDLSGFISQVEVSKEGDLWLATKGGGLIKITESEISPSSKSIKAKLQLTMEDRLEDDYLMSVFQSRDSAIWYGYWDNGLGRYDPKKDKIHHYDFTKSFELNLKKYPIVFLTEIKEGNEDFLWVGSRGGGIYKLKFDSKNNDLMLLKHYQLSPLKMKGLSNNFINAIYKPSNKINQNQLWIGTENGFNILDLKMDTFSYINKSDGLQSQTVQSILEDEVGNIWISTTEGISCIHRLKGKLEINNFDKYDGLNSKSYYDKSSLSLDNGKLVFGGINGLNYFVPNEIKRDTQPPKVSIVDFQLFNETIPIGELEDGRTILKQNISETKEIEISHQDNVLSFEFVGLQSAEPQKLQYAHMLEGFHNDWVYSDASERVAHFTNLPYETFQFKVKAANADGIWSEPVRLTLTVTPPFWRTNIAYFFYFILLSGLLYGVMRVIKMRTEFRHSLQLEKLEREKLKEVNKMKLQFFTNISHELRTPLTLIISPLEQFIREQSFEKTIHRSIVRMHHNANRLLTMINQLLDIRKSESGLMKLKVAEGDFVKFSNEIFLSFKGIAEQKEIEIKFSSEEPNISVWYDRDQMEKVWFNLLSNAIKFTPEKGKIKIDIFNDDIREHIVISVKDSGIGISEEEREKVFNRFYQIEENSEAIIKGGTGIGLALSKSIVEAHHGKIWIEGNGNDPGSTFLVAFPKGQDHFDEDEKIIDFQNSEKISNYILAESSIAKDETNQNEIEQKILKKDQPLILIVEDNADIRSYLKENLEGGYRIMEATDGEDGLRKAINDIPDLILADISMPKMDGIEMCKQLKSEVSTSHIPIILLTARTSLIFKIDGMEQGADDYVTKPFNMQLLKSRIKNLIFSREKLKVKFAKDFDLSPSGIVMNSLDEQLLSQMKLVVEKNIDNSEFSVEQLASALHVSRMQLYRKLKALTGKSPNRIIRGIRLQRAAQLLETKQYNVSDVTYMVGYNDLKYFRDQFKKEYGMSPSEYMK